MLCSKHDVFARTLWSSNRKTSRALFRSHGNEEDKASKHFGFLDTEAQPETVVFGFKGS